MPRGWDGQLSVEMKMKIAFVASPSAKHQVETAQMLCIGVAAHGDVVTLFPSVDVCLPEIDQYDVVCLWGWRKGEYFRPYKNVLVMERAYLADRFHWVSLGWNGLNGYASWPECFDPNRWQEHFAHLMRPWRKNPDGYALVLGQVTTDMSVRRINYGAWVRQITEDAQSLGYRVLYRPHPKQPHVVPSRMEILGGTLEQALAGARFTVSYNSNSGVDSVMAGVPAVILDKGGMAWDMASHNLAEPELCPDREEWGRQLACKQWLPEELKSGAAWNILRAAMPPRVLR